MINAKKFAKLKGVSSNAHWMWTMMKSECLTSVETNINAKRNARKPIARDRVNMIFLTLMKFMTVVILGALISACSVTSLAFFLSTCIKN